MRTKNARAITEAEAEHLALVKSVPCVFCNSPAPVEAHHPRQGCHFMTVAACKRCHDAHAWRVGHPNEIDAINETLRRVDALRSGRSIATTPTCSLQNSTRTPTKIFKRREAA